LTATLSLLQGVPSNLNGAYAAAYVLAIVGLVCRRIHPGFGWGFLAVVTLAMFGVAGSIGWKDAVIGCGIVALPMVVTSSGERWLAEKKRRAHAVPAGSRPEANSGARPPTICIGCGAPGAAAVLRCPYCGRPRA
jgi:hypothetical protein